MRASEYPGDPQARPRAQGGPWGGPGGPMGPHWGPNGPIYHYYHYSLIFFIIIPRIDPPNHNKKYGLGDRGCQTILKQVFFIIIYIYIYIKRKIINGPIGAPMGPHGPPWAPLGPPWAPPGPRARQGGSVFVLVFLSGSLSAPPAPARPRAGGGPMGGPGEPVGAHGAPLEPQWAHLSIFFTSNDAVGRPDPTTRGYGPPYLGSHVRWRI